MKLVTDNLPPSLTSGNLSPVSIGISDNAEDQLMILNVLSNTLYTDKVAAVLREYGCNAFDANVEAGKGDQPIEVTLPNKLEPSVRIRDFGYGMNEQQIADVFCKLGRSTKRNSNAFTGMLGIGSKAGFAYGDSFMVTSWADGKKIVYNAFRDQGAPRLAKMLETASDAPDGIEVKVPVRVADIQEFVTKAERIFRYFKVQPIIHGAKIDFRQRDARFEGTGWRYTGNGASFAIMGNVGYDLTLSGMGLDQYSGGTEAALIQAGVELIFEIGELEIAANREGLQYRDITKKAVKTRLQTVVGEIADVFKKQIAGAPTLWDAHKAYHEAFEKTGASDVRRLRDLVDGKIVWSGVKIRGSRFEIGNVEKDPEVNVWMAERHAYYSRTHKQPNPSSCMAHDNTVLVINDLPSKKNSPTRVKGFFEQNKTATQLVIFTFHSPAAQARYWKARGLEGAPTVKMSTLPQSLAAQKQSTGGNSAHRSKHSASVFVLDETMIVGRSDARSLAWNRVDVDLKKDGGSYVRLSQFYVLKPNGVQETPNEFRQKVVAMRKAGLITGPVYGLKHDKVAKVTANKWTQWERLEETVEKNLDAAIAKGNAPQELADYLYVHNHNSQLNEAGFQKLRLPSGTPLHTLFTEMHRMRNPKTSKELRDLIDSETAEPWVVTPKIPKPSVDLDALEKDVRDSYPMVGLLVNTAGRHATSVLAEKSMNVIADYIRLVESV
jgi:hypothetical protein